MPSQASYTSKMNPLISIVIPNYNGVLFVEEALESALNQDYKNKEVIVVDDGSTDGSVELLRTYKDRIRIIETENRGALDWLKSTSSGAEWKPISDMHSYGTWLLSEYPRNVRFGKWINLRVSRTLLSGYSKKDAEWMFKELESKFQKYHSVSFHHYLKDNFVGSE